MALLGSADMLIGTSASTTARLALLAMVGRGGVLPPFAMVDRALGPVFTTVQGKQELVVPAPSSGWQLRLTERRAVVEADLFDPAAGQKLRDELARAALQ